MHGTIVNKIANVIQVIIDKTKHEIDKSNIFIKYDYPKKFIIYVYFQHYCKVFTLQLSEW